MDRKVLRNVMLGCFCLGNGLLGTEILKEETELISLRKQAKKTYGNMLLRAIVLGNEPLVKQLLEQGGDLNQVAISIDEESGETRRGEPPLNYAVASGNLKAVEIFLAHGANVNPGNSPGRQPLYVAVCSDNPDQLRIIELLLEQGANPNTRDGDGRTPLMLLADHILELTELHYRFFIKQDTTFDPSQDICRCFQVLELLIDHGTYINTQDNNRNTALLRVISAEHPDFKLVRALIEYGVDVNIPNNDGNTALACAIANKKFAEASNNQRLVNIHKQIIELLRKHGATEDQP
jgi:ankyrin repeat protein